MKDCDFGGDALSLLLLQIIIPHPLLLQLILDQPLPAASDDLVGDDVETGDEWKNVRGGDN